MDCEISKNGSKTTLLFGPKFLSAAMYQFCSAEVITDAQTHKTNGGIAPKPNPIEF